MYITLAQKLPSSRTQLTNPRIVRNKRKISKETNRKQKKEPREIMVEVTREEKTLCGRKERTCKGIAALIKMLMWT